MTPTEAQIGAVAIAIWKIWDGGDSDQRWPELTEYQQNNWRRYARIAITEWERIKETNAG